MTDCIATIEGCRLCAARNARRDPDHQCAAMCEIALDMMDTPKGHRLSHEPIRHDCGHILDDRRGNEYRGPRRVCRFGYCTQFFCPGCRRYEMGWGPIECRCETHRQGHGTYDEFARPHPPVKGVQAKPEPKHSRYSRHERKKVRNPERG